MEAFAYFERRDTCKNPRVTIERLPLRLLMPITTRVGLAPAIRLTRLPARLHRLGNNVIERRERHVRSIEDLADPSKAAVLSHRERAVFLDLFKAGQLFQHDRPTGHPPDTCRQAFHTGEQPRVGGHQGEMLRSFKPFHQ